MKKKHKVLLGIVIGMSIIFILIINYNKIIYIYKSKDYKLCNIVSKKYIDNYEIIAKKALEASNGINVKYIIYNQKEDYKLNIKEKSIFIELNKDEDLSMKNIINNSMKAKIKNIDIYDRSVIFYPEEANCAIVKTDDIKNNIKFLKNDLFKSEVVYFRITNNWYAISQKKI